MAQHDYSLAFDRFLASYWFAANRAHGAYLWRNTLLTLRRRLGAVCGLEGDALYSPEPNPWDPPEQTQSKLPYPPAAIDL